jgi:WD40 repeat protein
MADETGAAASAGSFQGPAGEPRGGPRRRTLLLGAGGVVVAAAGVSAGLYFTRSTGLGLLAELGGPGVPFNADASNAQTALAVRSVAFAPSGAYLAAFHDGQNVSFWSLTDPAHPSLMANKSATAPLGYMGAFLPDGKTLITVGTQGAMLSNVADPTQIERLTTLQGPAKGANWVGVQPGGRLLAVASTDAAGDEAQLSLWDPGNAAAPTLLSSTTPDGYAAIDSLSFNSDGSILAAGSSDASEGSSGLWNLADPRHPAALGGFTGDSDYGAGDAVYSPSGNLVATVGGDAVIRLWDAAVPSQPALLSTYPDQPQSDSTDSTNNNVVNGFAFSPDGRYLATAGGDSVVRLWDVTNPAHPVLHTTLTGHSGAATDVVFSPNGSFIATSSIDHTVRLWNAGGL